jgi:hypothetical protein
LRGLQIPLEKIKNSNLDVTFCKNAIFKDIF